MTMIIVSSNADNRTLFQNDGGILGLNPRECGTVINVNLCKEVTFCLLLTSCSLS